MAVDAIRFLLPTPLKGIATGTEGVQRVDAQVRKLRHGNVRRRRRGASEPFQEPFPSPRHGGGAMGGVRAEGVG
jgi:hypothetical protein